MEFFFGPVSMIPFWDICEEFWMRIRYWNRMLKKSWLQEPPDVCHWQKIDKGIAADDVLIFIMWEYRDKIIHFRVVYSLKHFISVKELNIGYLVIMAKILKLGANRKWYKKSWEIRTWKYLKINWKMHNYVLEWRKEAKSISRIKYNA